MVEINNLTTAQVNESLVKKAADHVLKKEKIAKATELSIAFIGPGRMRKLNKTYKKRNRVTDVLAFPEAKIAFDKFRIGPAEKIKGLGEIVICLREVKKNAKKYDTIFDKELARIVIHGLLHLLGYDHEKSAKEADRMEEKEKEYLKTFDISLP